jgi:hypothetical protein
MKKTAIATLAGLSIAALTATSALAWSNDLTIRTPYKHTASTALSVRILGAKADCDVKTKLYDETSTVSNTDVTGWTSNDGWSVKKVVTTAFDGVTYATVALGTPALAGYYQINSNIITKGLGCKHLGDGTSDSQDIVVGTNVYIDNVDWNVGDEITSGSNKYPVQFVGTARANATDRLRAGVSVELWVPSLGGDKLVKVASDVTNGNGEFEINYNFDTDLHDSDNFQLRVTRTAKFFQDFSNDSNYDTIF